MSVRLSSPEAASAAADRAPQVYQAWRDLSIGYRRPTWEQLIAEWDSLSDLSTTTTVPPRYFAHFLRFRYLAQSVREYPELRRGIRRTLQQFLATTAWEIICARFAVSPRRAFPLLDAQRTAALWALWLVQRYPAISRLVLEQPYEQHFANYRQIPLSQFVAYVPRFVLFRFADSLRSTNNAIWIRWLANGKSLRKAPNQPFPLTKKATHAVLQAPFYLTFPEAFVYGIVSAEGGTEADFRRIRHLYPSILRTPDRREEIVRLLIRHPDRIDADQFQRLSGYLAHRFHEEARFSLAKRTLPALLRQMEAWYAHLQNQNLHRTAPRRANLPKTWKPLPFRGYEEQEDVMVYEIIQLCSLLELEAEGQILKHCAADYALRCAQGKTSIWSLRRYPTHMHITGKLKRLLTIELSPEGKIVQARGEYNASPGSFEKRLLKNWARKEGLTLKSY